MTFEQVATLVRFKEEAWKAYKDAETDASILARMNERNPVAVTSAEVAEAEDKRADCRDAWVAANAHSEAAFRELCAEHDIKPTDFPRLYI